jgi:hypothetical protein
MAEQFIKVARFAEVLDRASPYDKTIFDGDDLAGRSVTRSGYANAGHDRLSGFSRKTSTEVHGKPTRRVGNAVGSATKRKIKSL